MLSFPSFPFIAQVFLENKTNKNQLLLYTFYWFYPQCHFRIAPHVFLSLQISPLLFLISWAFFFFVVDIHCLFWVSALDLSLLLSSNLSVASSRSCLFSERSSPPRPVPLISSLVFDQYLFTSLLKWSRRLRNVTVNSTQLFEINGYILPYGSFSPTFTHIYIQIYRCS